jgi:hypothetical protein
MHSHLASLVGLLLALAWTDLAAQQPACTLLTPEDVETTTGAKLLEPHKTNMIIPSGPQKGQEVNGCMWGVPGRGMVSISMMPMPEGISRDAAMAKLEETYAQLRAQHWTEERKTFPDGFCSIMAPPPGKEDTPIMAGCITEAKGQVVSSVFMSPTQHLSMGQTRALMDKALHHMN